MTISEQIKVLINIEAQRSSKASKLGYHLDNRIIYYLGRMISSQKEVEFTKSEYDNLKAVRSIWICMDAADDEDSINRIVLTQETLFGKDINLSNLDKVQGVIIRLRSNENSESSKNTLIAMLEELLRKESADIKKERLSEDFGIIMNTETERRVSYMCNLSEILIERGIEQGLERGIEQGIERGIEQGLERGIERGIEQGLEAFITDKLEDKISADIIIKKLERKFGLTHDKAIEYLKKYTEKFESENKH